MIMSDEEKDKLIKEKLSNDTYVFSGKEEYNNKIVTELDSSKIKPNRFTKIEKKIFIFSFLIILIFAIIAYYYYNKYEKAVVNIDKPISEVNTNENKIKENEIQDNTKKLVKEENNTVNDDKTKKIKVEVPQKQDDNLEENTTENEEVVEQEARNEFEKRLQDEIKLYSLSINRFDGNIDSKEEYTTLIVAAIIAIDENKSEVTRSDAAKFIEEFVGAKISNPLDIDSKYVKYNENTDKYYLIKEGNPYIFEESKILNFNITSDTDDKLEVTGTIEKNSKTDINVYQFSAYLTKNKPQIYYFTHKIDGFNYKLIKTDKNKNIVIEKL